MSTENTPSRAAVHSPVENFNLEVPKRGLLGEGTEGVPSFVVEGGVREPPIIEETNPVSSTMRGTKNMTVAEKTSLMIPS